MELKNKAVQSLKWSFSIQFGLQSINFIVSILLARILLPEEFGLIGMIGIFIAIGKSLIDGGMTSSLIRTKEADQADYSTVFFMNLAISVALYLIMFITAPLIAFFFDQKILIDLIRVLCLTFIIGAFSTVQSTRLNKNLQFKTQFILAIPALIISSSLSIWMAYNNFGVWSLVFKDIVFSGLATIQLWIFSKWVPSFVFDWGKFKHHFNFGYKLTASGIINTIFDNFYQIIIGKYFSATQLGFYTRARSMQDLPTSFLVSGFNRVAFPLLSQLKEDNVRLKSVYRRLMVMVIFFVVPIMIIAAVVAVPLFRFLLTEKWLPAVPYFQILCIAGILFPIHQYNLNICYVKGRSDIVLRLSVLQNSLTFIGAILAIWLGIYGLLWSLVAINLIIALVNAYFSGRLINYSLSEQLKDISPILSWGIIAGLFAYVLDQFMLINKQDIVRLVISPLFALIVYFTISIATKSPAILEIKLFVKPGIQRIKTRYF